MKIPMLLALALCVSAAAACRKESAERAESVRVDAGDLCQHHVLQAICTKCNPKLAAVFQAKGDWCVEHGLPESVCPICHPERGGRPARDVTVKPSDTKPNDDVPADGTKVRLKTKEAAQLAGISTAAAETRNVGDGVKVVARIAYDARRLAQVNARSRGVVRALHAELGTKVQRGALLADIESAEVGADRSRVRGAATRVETSQRNFDRVQSLRTDGLGTEKELVEARRELESAKAEHAALTAGLSMAGGGAGGVYSLKAPLPGVVTKRTATIGKLVGIEELLFEIVDTSIMWAELDVPERDLPNVARGQEAVIQLDGLPHAQFRGKIDFVTPALDPQTRTALARIALDNKDGSLRANMFGNARILSGPARTGVFVPTAAVQRVKTAHVVFIRASDDLFETRRVTLGAREGAATEVATGLKSGEMVATEGSFLLKTEISKDAIGSGCCGEN